MWPFRSKEDKLIVKLGVENLLTTGKLSPEQISEKQESDTTQIQVGDVVRTNKDYSKQFRRDPLIHVGIVKKVGVQEDLQDFELKYPALAISVRETPNVAVVDLAWEEGQKIINTCWLTKIRYKELKRIIESA